jgi:hypothetical protein
MEFENEPNSQDNRIEEILLFEEPPFLIMPQNLRTFYKIFSVGIDNNGLITENRRDKDSNVLELEEGLDITEIIFPQSLVVETPHEASYKQGYQQSIFQIRELAELANCKYYSYRPFANQLVKRLAETSLEWVYKVQPRLFRELNRH